MHIYQRGAFIPHLLSTTMTRCYIYLLILPSLLGVTFSNAVSTLKAEKLERLFLPRFSEKNRSSFEL